MALKRDPEKTRAWRQRSKPLKRGKGLKRTAPKNRGRNASGQPHDIIEQAVIDAMRRFKLAAAGQKVCARCGRSHDEQTRLPLPWDAHHVVPKSWLKANGFSRVEQYDPDNALRLCENCHDGHEHQGGKKRLHLGQLKTRNLRYAFRIMGASAGSFLRRRYLGHDDRLDALEREHGQAA